MMQTLKTKPGRCLRCGGTLRWDNDELDPGLYCLNCGHRYRRRVIRPSELAGARRRQPAHGGTRL